MKYLIPVIFLLVACSGLENEIVSPNDIIELTVLDAKTKEEITNPLISDGTQEVLLRVKIPKEAEGQFQTVLFKSSKGSFQGVQNLIDKKKVNTDGVAEAFFKVPYTSERIFFSAEIDQTTYFSEKSIEVKAKEGILILEIGDETGIYLADGESKVEINAILNSISNDFEYIIFESIGGTFNSAEPAKIELRLNSNKRVKTSVTISNRPGSLYVTGKLKGFDSFSAEKVITIHRAFPDEIFIEPSSIALDSIGSTLIETYLKREIGSVSLNTKVEFSAFQLDSISKQEINVGRFTGLHNALSDDLGKVSVTFYSDQNIYSYNQPIFIKASCFRQDNSLAAESKILVLNFKIE
jgi:hypothetical protein